MDGLVVFGLVLFAFLLLDVLAMRYGVDSRQLR
jgi:hypothetical protein